MPERGAELVQGRGGGAGGAPTPGVVSVTTLDGAELPAARPRVTR